MILIPPEVEYALAEQERRPADISLLRDTVELALTIQFQKLADGMLANLLLYKDTVDNRVLWRHYLTRQPRSRKYFPDLTEQSFRSYCDNLYRDISSGVLKPLKISALNDVEVRLFGGYVKLWNDVAINHQLDLLQSDLQLYFLGSRDVGRNHLLAIQQREPRRVEVDARFIFGHVAPQRTCPLAPVFEFEREVAVSPYLSDEVVGLLKDDRILTRDEIIHTNIQLHRKGQITTDAEYAQSVRGERLHTLVHESVHLLPDMGRLGLPFFRVWWLDRTESDIRRFTIRPRSLKELEAMFEFNFFFFREDLFMDWVKRLKLNKLVYNLDKVIEQMLNNGSLRRNSEGNFCSTETAQESRGGS